MNRPTLPLAFLSDLQKPDPNFDIGDAREAVGQIPDAPDSLDLFPMVEDACENPDNPTGQHIYGGKRAERCMYCGVASGLDE